VRSVRFPRPLPVLADIETVNDHRDRSSHAIQVFDTATALMVAKRAETPLGAFARVCNGRRLARDRWNLVKFLVRRSDQTSIEGFGNFLSSRVIHIHKTYTDSLEASAPAFLAALVS
jgi:hypothetical protein